MEKVNQILSDLKQNGHKITPVRLELISILTDTNHPLSITELTALLKAKELNPNKTTIYREIEFLKELQIIEEVDFGDGKKRYEISKDHHHHIMCINCKTIKDISMDEDVDLLSRKIVEKLGFKPVGHSLEFFGLCSNCQ